MSDIGTIYILGLVSIIGAQVLAIVTVISCAIVYCRLHQTRTGSPVLPGDALEEQEDVREEANPEFLKAIPGLGDRGREIAKSLIEEDEADPSGDEYVEI